MGVPAFFRWLSRKYPSVIIECVEKKTVNDDGTNIWECPSLPNPNGIEFDNLYLDMNGIIHPCTHPEDKPPPKNEDEMMIAIFECIDRLIAIVRPRKLIYMAIDGVAPRAKMNQQRSRRFRASKETVEKQLEIQRIKDKLAASGFKVPPEKPKEEHFDSNCITPGTPFMQRLSACLHYYIHDRLNNHPGWKGVKVILSDANVPGEGEHKIMDYIRRQRAQPDHDPNTQHVLCGADADLIMLGLATHEPNFTIIREEFLPNKPRPCDVCGQYGHSMNDCQGLCDALKEASSVEVGKEVQFIFVRLCVLREYLKKELYMSGLPFTYDFDRVLDDWVFMCFFVGNDFLPHLPSLEIREGAVDRLITLYKKCVYKTRDYLTDSGEVNLDGVQMIMLDLGLVEDQIFKERQRREISFRGVQKQREKEKKRQQRRVNFDQIHNSQFAPTPLGRGITPSAVSNPRQEAAKFRQLGMQSSGEDDSQSALKAMMRPGNDDRRGTKRKADDMAADEDKKQEKDEEEETEEEEIDNDEVRLYEDGFKDRYYESKFDVTSENLEFRYTVALQYVRGLCWVLKYYYQGCVSWDWYFPYHYAPFASDFIHITGLSTKFDKKTKPFNPLEQLMGVFPAASSKHIPDAWAPLMSDPKSPIIDFYPEDFQIDLNGKKFAWQGVALLPFVDEKRLFKALKSFQNKLTDAEIQRNSLGDDRLYIGPGNTGYKLLKDLYKNKVDDTVEVPISIEGMQGNVLITEECVEQNGLLPSPVIGLQDVLDNNIFTVKYKIPTYPEHFVFPARRLPKAVDPPTILKPGHLTGNDSYKPRIGFNQNYQSARLDNSGFRAINHYANRNNRFSSPPSGGSGGGYQNNRGGNNRDNYQNYNRSGGGGGSSGNGGNNNERYHPYQQGNTNYQSHGNSNQQQQSSTYGQYRQQQQQQRSNNYSTDNYGSSGGGSGGGGGSTNNRFQGQRNNSGNKNDSYNNQRNNRY